MIPVDLSHQHLASVPLARSSDLAAATVDEWMRYTVAAKKLGLTPKEYAEYTERLRDGGATYERLPRHIDAMSARRRNGEVYVRRNVVVPADTMGWVVTLGDGNVVLVPRVCGNLSANFVRAYVRHRPVAFHNFPVPHPKPQAVTFTAPVTAIDETTAENTAPVVSAAPAPAAAPESHRFAAAWFAPLIAPIAGLFNGGGSTNSGGGDVVGIPPCSAGSNALGVCQR